MIHESLALQLYAETGISCMIECNYTFAKTTRPNTSTALQLSAVISDNVLGLWNRKDDKKKQKQKQHIN